jgi:hypothetical protein
VGCSLRAVSPLIQTCRDLRDDLDQLFKLSPLLAFSPKGRVAVHRTQTLLEQLEDLADRVTVLELAQTKGPK